MEHSGPDPALSACRGQGVRQATPDSVPHRPRTGREPESLETGTWRSLRHFASAVANDRIDFRTARLDGVRPDAVTVVALISLYDAQSRAL